MAKSEYQKLGPLHQTDGVLVSFLGFLAVRIASNTDCMLLLLYLCKYYVHKCIPPTGPPSLWCKRLPC